MKRVCLPIFLLVLFFLTACGSSQAKTLPDGVYKRDEITGSGTNSLTTTLNKGHFQMESSQQGPLWEGSYQVTGDKITFTSEKSSTVGKAFCGSKDNFTYQWSFDAKNNQAVFKQDDDPCSLRSSGTAGGSWAYQALQQ